MSVRGLAVAVVMTVCAAMACGTEAFAAGAPTVSGQRVDDASVTSASFAAEINPNEAATAYRFEYGFSVSYGSSVPVPDGSAGSGAEFVTVTQNVSGLEAGSTYHYRVVASSAEGVTTGPDMVFKTYPAEVGGGDSCVNALIRTTQASTNLPDCRAYEMVSPPPKGSADIATDPTRDQSSQDGEAITYWSTVAFGEALGTEVPGAQYVSRRGKEGWSIKPINPPANSPTLPGYSARYVYFSPDLSKGVYSSLDGDLSPTHPNVAEVSNLYVRNDIFSEGLGEYRLMSDSATPLPYQVAGSYNHGASFAAASADMSHVIFESPNNLLPQTSGLDPHRPKLYEWVDGALTVAGVLPNGEVASESTAGPGAGGGDVELSETNPTESSMSTDGSRVLFTGPPLTQETGGSHHAQGNLYMRIDGSETVHLNASERSEPDPNGFQPATFWGASSDDSRIFFVTHELLTDDATAGGGSIYMYDVNAPAGKHLTLIPGGSSVFGVSTDGHYAYVGGSNDLSVWHDGTSRHITNRLSGVFLYWNEITLEWAPTQASLFRVTPSGQQAVFVNVSIETAEQAGVSPIPGTTAKCPEVPYEGRHITLCWEVYVYDYASDRITCASCKQSGAAQSGQATFSAEQDTGPLAHPVQYLKRPITSDGHYVFFESDDNLVPQAVNGRWNVYEYDMWAHQLHLISSGACNCDSHFIDAGADGRNVFFTTHQQLVRRDVDNKMDLYDARIDGGIASQNEAGAVACEGDDCQGPAAPAPVFSLPTSSTFSGVGNAPASSKPIAKHRQIKKSHKAKKHKKPKKRVKKKVKKARKSGSRRSHRAGR